MTTRFKLVGNGTFLGKAEIPTEIYEWEPEPKRFGKLKIRFVVPLDGPPRRFYIEPILHATADPIGQTEFVIEACDYGYQILRAIEEHDETQEIAYGMFAAVFRNRHRGHLGIARKFASPQDFVDFSSVHGSPSLITPGLDASFISPVLESNLTTSVDFRLHRSVQARRMIENAIADATDGEMKTSRVLQYYQDRILDDHQAGATKNAGTKITLCLDRLPHRSELDVLFTDGVVRNSGDFDWPATMAAVRQSVIGGPCSNTDFARVDDDAYRICIARVADSYRKLTPSQFDKWLKNVREHGFLQLIKGGTRLPGDERAEAKTLGKTMFCMLLWDSYQHMARCYGMLMWTIWLHLAIDEEMGTNLIEEEIFRRFHLPQMYLGGLPLDFLTPHQLRWIIGPLQQLWSECRFDAESYDPITKLLSVFSVLVRDRRSADRNAKAFKGRPEELFEPPGVEDKELVLTARPFAGALDCPNPNCGDRLSFDRVIHTDKHRIVFVVVCPQCAKEFAFQCDPNDLEKMLAASKLDG